MLIGKVVGTATSTTKHRSLNGRRLLVVQPVDAAGGRDGDPVLAVDALGAGTGARVMLTSDGGGTRELVGDKTSPARYSTLGILD